MSTESKRRWRAKPENAEAERQRRKQWDRKTDSRPERKQDRHKARRKDTTMALSGNEIQHLAYNLIDLAGADTPEEILNTWDSDTEPLRIMIGQTYHDTYLTDEDKTAILARVASLREAKADVDRRMAEQSAQTKADHDRAASVRDEWERQRRAARP